LQDFTGVPLVVDLAAMRSTVKRLGGDPKIIEPLVRLIWWSIIRSRSISSVGPGVATQSGDGIQRNRERYQF